MDEKMWFTKQNISGRKSSSSGSYDEIVKKYIRIEKRRARRSHTRELRREGEDQERRSASSRLLTDFTIVRTIGKGGSGKVMEVIHNIDNNVYAIKMIKLKPMENLENIIREAKLLSRLQHENIVRYFGVFNDETEETTESETEEESTVDSNCNNITNTNGNSSSPGTMVVYEDKNIPPRNRWINTLCIQMEFCQTTLADAISNHLWRDHAKAWRMFWEIVNGAAYLHQNFVIHRDLKPVNIFLDAYGRIKIGDFGLATKIRRESAIDEQVSESLSGEIGTSYYRAPELDNSGTRAKYGQEVDIYSLGIILFEMFNPPFNSGHERHDVLTKLRTPDIIMPDKFLDNENNDEPIYLLRWLLNHVASSRPTSDDLLNFQKNKHSSSYEHFQRNIMMEKNNPLQPTNAFYNKIPNTESKHAYGHSI